MNDLIKSKVIEVWPSEFPQEDLGVTRLMPCILLQETNRFRCGLFNLTLLKTSRDCLNVFDTMRDEEYEDELRS